MGVNDTYQTVKTKAMNLRKKIMDRIFDSRFDSMLDAIDKSSEISKIIGNRINMAGSTFNAFGKPLKICYPNIVSPSLISTDDKAITPKWNGQLITRRVNNVDVTLLPVPELDVNPADILTIGKKIGKSVGYSVYIYEKLNEANMNVYDIHDWEYGYILPTSVLSMGYGRYEITGGAVVAPLPIDITSMLAGVVVDSVFREAYYRCWYGDGYYVEFYRPNVVKVMCNIFVDCNITLYDKDKPTEKLTSIYAPVIVRIFEIVNADTYSLRITNVGELKIESDILWDAYAFFGNYSPTLNRVKIGESCSIYKMSGSC